MTTPLLERTPSTDLPESLAVADGGGTWANLIVRRSQAPLAATLREVADAAWERLRTTTPNAALVSDEVVRVDNAVLCVREIAITGAWGGGTRTQLQAVCLGASTERGRLDQIEVTAVARLGTDPHRDAFLHRVAQLQRTPVPA